MNPIERFIESILSLLGSIAGAIEEGVSAFVSKLQEIAQELARFFVRMVKWAARAAHSLWIIFLFFIAMLLSLSVFMEMGYADSWLVKWSGWTLFALTILLCIAAVLRMFSPSRPATEKKYHMGVPLLVIDVALVLAIALTASYRPLRSPLLSFLNEPGREPQSQIQDASPVTLQPSVHANSKAAKGIPSGRLMEASTNAPPKPVHEELSAPKYLSCTATRSEDYAPVTVLQQVTPSRPPTGGDAAGQVQLTGKIDSTGRAYDLAVLHSELPPEFGEEAIRAVAQWQFAPARWRDRAVECRLKITIAFEAK